jgi:hypothetical protein
MSRQNAHIAAQFERERQRQAEQRAYQRQLEQRHRDEFAQFSRDHEERRLRDRELEIMRHNRPMAIIGTAIAVAIGNWLSSRFIGKREPE